MKLLIFSKTSEETHEIFLGSYSLGNNERIGRFKQNLHLCSLVLFFFYRVSHTFGHKKKSLDYLSI